MSVYVKKIEAFGVYGRFDIQQEFTEGINIIYGKNGAGKTTLLHILVNALSGDFYRFRFLPFNYIEILLSNHKYLKINHGQGKKDGPVEARLDRKKLSIDVDQNSMSEQDIGFSDYMNMRNSLLDQGLSEADADRFLERYKRRVNTFGSLIF